MILMVYSLPVWINEPRQESTWKPPEEERMALNEGTTAEVDIEACAERGLAGAGGEALATGTVVAGTIAFGGAIGAGAGVKGFPVLSTAVGI